ncbi:MAG: T9SS type A sorting domain-containing protein, partial [Bacteroidota bacterium]
HIPENWLAGLTEVNFTNRDMVPDENGTMITVTQGNTVSQSLTLTLDASWVQNNMQVVAFLQDHTSKEVFNTVKLPLRPPTGQHDPYLTQISNEITGYSCETSFAPEVLVENLGSDDITSMTFMYNVNGGAPSSFNWTGNIPWGGAAAVMLPAISFTPIASGNMLNVDISSVNGGATDADLMNNSQDMTWDYEEDAGDYTFSLTTDDYGYETYWEIVSSGGTVMASGGNSTLSNGPTGNAAAGDQGAYGNNMTITETVTLSTNECYTVRLYDDFGDGICCSWGNGSYSLMDPYGNAMIMGGQFADEDATSWHTSMSVAIDDRLDEELTIFPNPANTEFTIQLGEGFTSETSISVLQLDGKEVFRTMTSANAMTVDVSELSAGIYMVKVQSEEGTAVKKLTVK